MTTTATDGPVKRAGLEPVLGAWQLWGLAVGLVISGEYFGWSYGWARAGTLGFLVTTAAVAVMYTSFIFSFTELTTAIPEAGGPFAYARRALGPVGGAVAGWATLVEFVLAPPAIALAIGAYIGTQFPTVEPRWIAVGAYAVFIALNVVGVTPAANFELFVALLAIAGLAMAAEEARDPHRTIPRAYLGGMLTLVVLALGVMGCAGGVGDWRALANINDPLPEAMRSVVGASSGWVHMLVWLGLFGLVASFHGIILGYSRQIFAMARAGYLPRRLAAIHPRFKTPWVAALAGGLVGVAAIFSDAVVEFGGQPLTANIVTMSVLGAMVMYVTVLVSLFVLRRTEPGLHRPVPAFGYPWVPGVALMLATLCLVTVVVANPGVSLAFGGLLAVAAAGSLRGLPNDRPGDRREER